MSLSVIREIAELGRNDGWGLSLVTQRPQAVHKGVLNLTECLVAHKTNGSHERKAIRDWAVDKDVSINDTDLTTLEIGQAWVWSPTWLKIMRKVNIHQKATFPASSTLKFGESMSNVAPPLPEDALAKLRESLKEATKHVEDHDPKALHRRIAELENSLRSRVQDPLVIAPPPAPLFSETDRRWLEHAISEIQIRFAETRDIARKASEKSNELQKDLNTFDSGIQRLLQKLSVTAAPTQAIGAKRPASSLYKAPLISVNGDGANLPPGEKAVLNAAAQSENGVTRTKITALTGYKRSTRDAYIYRLFQKGYLKISDASGEIIATPEGVSALGPEFEPLPKGHALLEYWMEKLPDGERAILAVAAHHYPNAIPREMVGDQYARSSRDAYIQRLAAKKLIHIEGRAIKASPELFG